MDKLQKTLQHLPKKEVKINKLDVNIKKVESKNLNEKEKLEEWLMQIQSKNGITCLKVLAILLLGTLAIYTANDLGLTDLIVKIINNFWKNKDTDCRLSEPPNHINGFEYDYDDD